MIKVTAAVIRQGEKVMICKRPKDKNHGGLWEFPGGKVEAGETLFDCIKRECREELCIELEPKNIITTIQNGEYEITFIESGIFSGKLTLTEHEDLMWISKHDTENIDFCPTDKMVLEKIFGSE